MINGSGWRTGCQANRVNAGAALRTIADSSRRCCGWHAWEPLDAICRRSSGPGAVSISGSHGGGNKVKKLQQALYVKAREPSDFRFYAFYDKIRREHILAHVYRLSRHNGGKPGMDGEDFPRASEPRDGRGRAQLGAGSSPKSRFGVSCPCPVRRARSRVFQV